MEISDIDELFGLGSETNPVMMLVWILPVILFVFYGQRIQLLVSSSEIKKQIRKLDEYGTHSMKETMGYVGGLSGARPGCRDRLAIMADYFSIPPVDMDPAGIVAKVRHTIRTREEYTKRQIETILPDSDPLQVARVQTFLEITASLRMIYRIVNHMYLTAKKQHNYPLILPLQMMLPFVMEEAKAMRDALVPFSQGQPVGDGIGPAVVGLMMQGLEKTDAAYQTVMSHTKIHDRDIILIKAKGPAPVIGRTDEALSNIVRDVQVGSIIMVDAALKMEGEESGTVSRGFGAAMGGSGTERFRIEETATQNNIPVFCVVVKQSIKESVTLMTDTIQKCVREAHAHVTDMIQEDSTSGHIVVIGVGNTGGVGQ